MNDVSMSKRRYSGVLILLLVIFLLKLMLYALVTPPWQVPDEPTHFEYAYLLYLEGSPFTPVEPDPVLQDQILQSMEKYHYWKYLTWPEPETRAKTFHEDSFLKQAPSQIDRSPPLYYMVGSLWLRLFSPETLLAAFYLLRIYSVILTFFFVTVLALLVKWAFPDDRDLALLALCFVVFLPQLSAMGVGVNSDAAINLVYAATIAACIKLAVEKRFIWLLSVLALVAASILSKKTGLATVPLVLFALVCGLQVRRRIWVRTVLLLTTLGVTLSFSHALLTWYYPVEVRKVVHSAGIVWRRLFDSSEFGGEYGRVAFFWLHESFWARFGWQSLRLPDWLYASLWPLNAWIAAGAVSTISGRDLRGSPDDRTRLVRNVVSFSGVLILVAVALRNIGDFQPHGRYLFPALPAIALWFAAAASLVPRRYRDWISIGVVTWLCFFDLAVLLRFVVVAFYLEMV